MQILGSQPSLDTSYIGKIAINVYTGNHSEVQKTAYFVTIETENLFFQTPLYADEAKFKEIFSEKSIQEIDAQKELAGFVQLFGNIENRIGYGSNSVLSQEQVEKILDRDSRRFLEGDTAFSGYVIFDKHNPETIIGRGAIGVGYSPSRDISDNPLTSYRAAYNETQCGVLIDRSLDPYFDLYKEAVFALMVATDVFNEMGIEMRGNPVTRFTVTNISLAHLNAEDYNSDLGYYTEMRSEVLDELGLESLGYIGPKDIDGRNFSNHVREVRGVDVVNGQLTDLIEENLSADSVIEIHVK